MRIERLNQLSEPRRESQQYTPNRPSVYWLDYIPDPIPHKIKDPQTLLQYYTSKYFTKFPRVEELAQAKPWPDSEPSRPTTQYGIPLSALKYVPSERIKILAEPFLRQSSNSCTSLPQIVSRKSQDRQSRDGWDWTNLPKTAMQRAVENSQSGSVDLSKGDFRARSRIRRIPPRTNEPRNVHSIRLPPIQHGQGENQPGYSRGSDLPNNNSKKV